MRSEKIGYFYRSPEGDTDWLADDLWGGPRQKELVEALDEDEELKSESGVGGVIAEKLHIDGDELETHVNARLRDFGLDVQASNMNDVETPDINETPDPVVDTTAPVIEDETDIKDKDSDLVVATPISTPVVEEQILRPGLEEETKKDRVVVIKTEVDEPVLTKRETKAPDVVVNLDQFDEFSRDQFTRVDIFLRSPINKKEGGDKKGASIVVAKSILGHLGYRDSVLEELAKQNDGKDVVVLAKQWVYARRAGDTDLYTQDFDKAAEIVNKLDALAYDQLLTPSRTEQYRREIARLRGPRGAKLENILNYAISIEDSERVKLQAIFREAIKNDGGLATGEIKTLVKNGFKSVGDLRKAEIRGEIKISNTVKFVEAAGIKVNDQTTWSDLTDKKNVIMLQLMVDKRSMRQVLAMTPDDREKMAEQLRGLVWGMFLRKDANNNILAKDPAKNELDSEAEDFANTLTHKNTIGKAFVLDYMNSYREYLKSRYRLDFQNEHVERKATYLIKTPADVERIFWNDLDAIENDPKDPNFYSVGSNITQQFKTIVESMKTQNIITDKEAKEYIKLREAAVILKNLKEDMYNSPSVSENQQLLRMVADLEGQRKMETLINMRVTSEINGVRQEIRIGGKVATVAHIIVEWDERMRVGQEDNAYYNIWDDRINLTDIAMKFGGNVQAARIARDLYFVTGGAARYEISKIAKENAAGQKEFKKQKLGAIGFRDIFNPVELKYAQAGPGDNFGEDRLMMVKGTRKIPGVDFKVASFWDHDNPEDKVTGGTDAIARAAEFRKRPDAETFTDYSPLTVARIHRRIEAMSSESKTMQAWLKRVKGAEGAMKAEEEYLLATDSDGFGKFKELTRNYLYLGPVMQEVVANRAKLRLEYIARRANVKRSGFTATRAQVKSGLIGYVRQVLPHDKYNEVLDYFNAIKKRIPEVAREDQLTQEQLEVHRKTRGDSKWGFLGQLAKDIFNTGIS